MDTTVDRAHVGARVDPIPRDVDVVALLAMCERRGVPLARGGLRLMRTVADLAAADAHQTCGPRPLAPPSGTAGERSKECGTASRSFSTRPPALHQGADDGR